MPLGLRIREPRIKPTLRKIHIYIFIYLIYNIYIYILYCICCWLHQGPLVLVVDDLCGKGSSSLKPKGIVLTDTTYWGGVPKTLVQSG